MKVGLDLMGGDFAPLKALEGIVLFLEEDNSNNSLVLLGNKEILEKTCKNVFQRVLNDKRVSFIHTDEIIDMSDIPTRAFNSKKNSSISVGFSLLQKNDIDAFASAGNTGAMMVGAYYAAKPIEGVIRPAISTLIPKLNNSLGLLLDVGVNPDCRQDVLHQFGHLGTAFLKSVYGISNPKVGLLNIGSEAEKGNLVSQAAYQLLANDSNLNFIGNIEGYDVFGDKADVIVCDGFTGNVLLKSIEGFFNVSKVQNVNDSFINKLNYENYGGTPVLGISKTVVVAHGKSSEIAFKNIIRNTIIILEKNLNENLQKQLKSIVNI